MRILYMNPHEWYNVFYKVHCLQYYLHIDLSFINCVVYQVISKCFLISKSALAKDNRCRYVLKRMNEVFLCYFFIMEVKFLQKIRNIYFYLICLTCSKNITIFKRTNKYTVNGCDCDHQFNHIPQKPKLLLGVSTLNQNKHAWSLF